MASERFSAWLYRYRYAVFAGWLVHAFVIHYLVLGLMTWDGFGHRGIPLVELLQHGSLGKDKYDDWSMQGTYPFIELIQIPFLYVFKTAGFLIGFPLVAFPLSVLAVFAMVRELTGDGRAATFGALGFVALPMMNQQPFTAYIDFAVCGLVAFFVYAVLRMRSDPHGGRAWVRLLVATALFTLSRSQGVYVVILVLPALCYALFVERTGVRLQFPMRRALLLTLAAAAIGSIPAISIQIWKFLHYGSPTHPLQFKVFGITIGGGVSMDDYFRYAGLSGADWPAVAKGFFEGWIFHAGWPVGAFFASQHMGGGLVLWVALALTPTFLRHATRVELWLVLACLVVSVLARDMAIPRCAYTLIVALSVVIGRAMGALIASPRARWLFWAAAVILLLHLLRPGFDILQVRSGKYVSPRMNVSGSSLFIRTASDVVPFPDLGQRFAVIESPGNGFAVPIFGLELGNEVVDTIPQATLGPGCVNLTPILAADPTLLFVDDYDYAKSCQRECAVPTSWGACRAYRITPAPPAAE